MPKVEKKVSTPSTPSTIIAASIVEALEDGKLLHTPVLKLVSVTALSDDAKPREWGMASSQHWGDHTVTLSAHPASEYTPGKGYEVVKKFLKAKGVWVIVYAARVG